MRLTELLYEAAELEHGLTCQYLFAAFSLKRRRDEGPTYAQLEKMRGWGATLLLIARQEMEHLGLVANLLTAIGESPYLRRPNFPISARHYPMNVESVLQPFGTPALTRFLLFEMPVPLDDAERGFLEGIIAGFDPSQYTTIGDLYGEIASLLKALGAAVFVGRASAQLVDPDNPALGVRIPGAGRYNVLLSPITDLETAVTAIDQIIEEGEGGPLPDEPSHFSRLRGIHDELLQELAADPSFTPARPAQPLARPDDDTGVPAPQVDPTVAGLVELFDLAYETLVMMLYRVFAADASTASDVATLTNAAFFPMMTTVIRPLGEIITELPMTPGSPKHAGPRFQFDKQVSLLPQPGAAWSAIISRLELLTARASSLTGQAGGNPAYPEPIRTRLELMWQNLARMTSDARDAAESVT